MWFMMETGGDVCLLLAVLHLITAHTDKRDTIQSVADCANCCIKAFLRHGIASEDVNRDRVHYILVSKMKLGLATMMQL